MFLIIFLMNISTTASNAEFGELLNLFFKHQDGIIRSNKISSRILVALFCLLPNPFSIFVRSNVHKDLPCSRISCVDLPSILLWLFALSRTWPYSRWMLRNKALNNHQHVL